MDGIVAPQMVGSAEAEEATPLLDLDGFSGPLQRLLTLARAHAIDLTRLSLVTLIDQLAAALRQAPAATPLSQKGDWVVMTAWLVQLRSRLLLPANPIAQQQAEAEAGQLRRRLVELQAMQGLAQWLDDRPQLGRDVFARGCPEAFAAAIEVQHAVDVVGFLWASLARFDEDSDAGDTAPQARAWFSIPQARARILRLLAETPEGERFERFLPDLPPEDPDGGQPGVPSLRRLAWGSTFIASLELAKQGDLTLAQDDLFAPIHVRPAPPSA
jgi:segregation and condensation protein A